MTSNFTSLAPSNETVLACHPLLLAQGFTSEKGLCDDAPSSYVISSIQLFVHSILCMVSLIGLIYKVRKIQQTDKRSFNSTVHVEHTPSSPPSALTTTTTTTTCSNVNYLTVARNPTLMTTGTIMSFLFVMIMQLRILIGRKRFPCFLYMLAYHFAAPSMSTTIVLRTIRVAMLGLLNQLKVKIGQRELEKYFNSKDRNTIEIVMPFVNDEAQQELEINSVVNTSTSVTHQGHVGSDEDHEFENIDLSDPPQILNGMVIDTNSCPNYHTSPNSSPSSSYPLSRMNSSTTFSMERKSQNTDSFFRNVSNVQVVTNDNKVICTSKSENNLLSMKLPTYETIALKMYTFLTSTKFVILFYTATFFIHLVLYLTIGSIDYYYWTTHESKQDQASIENIHNAWVLDSFIFSTSGCGSDTYNLYLFIAEVVVYLILVLSVSTFVLFVKRDVWKLKMEVFAIFLNWAILGLIYCAPLLLSEVSKLVDYYFPWAFFMFLAGMIDTFISVTIPVFFLQRENKSSHGKATTHTTPTGNAEIPTSATNEIARCLQHPEIYPLFLSFGERSYAPEDILCYNLIEQFKKSSQRNRKKIICTLCDTYLKYAAPLQLNLSNQDLEKLAPVFEMQQKILEENKQRARFSMSTLSRGIEIPSNFLNNLQLMSERNLLDLYERFYEEHQKVLKDKLGICKL
ncbi:hypothetical protein C9374_008759 [Naegleria lovaniensis]|uniref:RGS domain-containing protein n=1 Tax=Naegleria lovaniensis TaxID=51637 RepID=A0AA88GIT8_NAELO|nr:uncharacterized protein C9374_008759 [Naegleria lovaniensis]KAG2378137.1 hypothetical protein C9374_008759 [Naegleria lovaniensis]